VTSSPKLFVNRLGTQYREFGILKAVEVNDWGLLIYNQDNYCVGMKRVYYHFANIALKAQSLIDKEVLIETGASSSTTEYFRDIYHNFPNILDFDETKDLDLASSLVWARTSLEDTKHKLKVSEELAMRLREQLETVSAKDKLESETSSDELDKVWPSFEADPQRSVVIVGAAYDNKNNPAKVDKAFAFRLGIDTTRRKRINVNILKRTYKNFIKVELPEYDNIECDIAVKLGNRENIKNEWCVATVTNSYRGWEKLEEELYPEWKTTRKPIEWYMNAHDRMLTELINDVSNKWVPSI